MSKSAIDFLRLATWSMSEHAYLLADILTSELGEWKPGKWLQYHGWRKDSHFIGTAEQENKRHSILNISGYHADGRYRGLLRAETYYCTRIDLQITIQRPHGLRLAQVYSDLDDEKKNASLIQSKLNDTLYLGSRTSDVFIRLYEKPLDVMHLRLEFEFKGKVSRAIWRALQAKSTPDEVFQHYLKKSKLPDYVKVHFFDAQDGETAFAIRKEIEKSDANKLAWLRSIDASVRQAIYNHNIGNEVQTLVMSWANEASNVDIMNEND